LQLPKGKRVPNLLTCTEVFCGPKYDTEEFRHIWSDEEGSDGSIPVTEYYAFRDLPSDDEITAV